MNGFPLLVPLELAELLHATIGPLADQLAHEHHPWAPMLKRVMSEYTASRNATLKEIHGSGIVADIAHVTYLASEMVCALTEQAMGEEQDFIQWTSEVVDGESI